MKPVTVPFFISHQGCRHACVFCDQRIISGASGRLPGGAEILEKIERWRQSAGGRPLEVAFFGGTFTALDRGDQERLLQPLQPLLAAAAISSVRISTRPDAIDAGSVKWLTERGVRVIELGVQSMHDAVLEASGRGHSAAATEAALRCITAGGLTAGAQLMPGLPGDTPDLALDSLQRVIAAGAALVRFYPVVVLKGTELAHRFYAGKYRPLTVEEGVDISKRLLLMALKAGVKVARIGLQADEGLGEETVVAGCWHPALGFLVRAELYHDLLVRLLEHEPNTCTAKVLCHPKQIPEVRGHGNRILKRLAERGIIISDVLPDAGLAQWDLAIQVGDSMRQGSILHDLVY